MERDRDAKPLPKIVDESAPVPAPQPPEAPLTPTADMTHVAPKEGGSAPQVGKSLAPEEILADKGGPDATPSDAALPPTAVLPPSAAQNIADAIEATLSNVELPPSEANDLAPVIETTLSDAELPPSEAKPLAPTAHVVPGSGVSKTSVDRAPETIRRKPKRGVSKGLWGLLIFLGVVSVIAILALLLGPGYLKTRVEEEARVRGVVLVVSEIEYGLSTIVLTDVSLALVGVSDFRAKATSIQVDIVDWEPTAMRATGLEMALSGTEVLDQLSDWKAKYGKMLKAPFSAKDALIDFRLQAGDASGLSLSQANVAVVIEKGSIEAGSTRLWGRPMGPTHLNWALPAEGFVVEVKPQLSPLSALSGTVWSSKEGPMLKLTLARTAVGPLQATFGIPPGSEGIFIEGEVEMKVPSFKKKEPLEASIQMVVKGYVPPHPKELNGILFGDATKVNAKALIADDFGGAKLSQLTVVAGALALSGTGEVVRNGQDARVLLKLKGNIACTALASSAAVAHLGLPLGRIAGAIAAGALSGSVFVSLSIDSMASDIKGAKIEQNASIGCKIGLPGFPQIVLQ